MSLFAQSLDIEQEKESGKIHFHYAMDKDDNIIAKHTSLAVLRTIVKDEKVYIWTQGWE